MAQNPASSGPVRAILFLVVSMVGGIAATVVVWQLIRGYQTQIEEAERPEETVMAVVAARPLYEGVAITEEDIVLVPIAARHLPEGVHLDPQGVLGAFPRERILSNEFIRDERLANRATGIGLNALVPAGMRAISISVKDGQALSGFLNPGNHVDIMVTIVPEDTSRRPETHTLLQSVSVLAVNDRLDKNDSGVDAEADQEARRRRTKVKPSVTVAVLPEQAEQLAHAGQEGALTLALRNELDIGRATTDGVSSASLVGYAPTVVPRRRKTLSGKPVVEPSGHTLTVIRGMKVGQERVSN